MCGILGSVPASDATTFRQALNLIRHRGPDGEGVWSNEHIMLGHRRLAIIDLSDNGKQPMLYGNYCITFNGEIYNFIEIRAELQNKGIRFTTDSDTEVILAAYQYWGEKCLLKFNGMWAFAIWDNTKQQLFLARDRFGVKPLFYAFTPTHFVFCSEMKGIFPFLPQVQVTKNFYNITQNLFEYENTEACLIEGIKRFPAGSWAVLDFEKKTLQIHKYWDTLQNIHAVPVKYVEQVEQFRELFIDACKIRMRSDVAIGTALSGGLDSSSVISSMAYIAKHSHTERLNKNWQHAFVATFPNTFFDETIYAQQVAEHINIDATYLPIDPAHGIENIADYLWNFEELYITSPIPMIDIYKSMRQQGIVVSIDGHGADELFSGYGEMMLEALVDSGANAFQINNILNTYRASKKTDIETTQLLDEKIDFSTYFRFMKNRYRGTIPYLRYVAGRMLGRYQTENISIGKLGKFNTTLYNAFHNTVLPTLLRNYDRYAMANGVEIRMPFMDYRLVTFCFSLPWQSKIRNGYTKSILRDAMNDIIPDSIRLRKSKIGFNTPFIDWLQGAWKPFILDVIHSRAFEQCNLINAPVLRNKVIELINNKNAKIPDAEAIWVQLMYFFWEQTFINNWKNRLI